MKKGNLNNWGVVGWTGVITFLNVFFWIVFTNASRSAFLMIILNGIFFGVIFWNTIRSKKAKVRRNLQ